MLRYFQSTEHEAEAGNMPCLSGTKGMPFLRLV